MRSRPAWTRSIRFRLALTYSIVVFSLALLVVGAVNIALSRSLQDEPVSRRTELFTFVTPDGRIVAIEGTTVQSQMTTLEHLVNMRAQQNLQRFSLWALLGMFPVSILIGWLVADRVLHPIEEITNVARQIQASDLSRRIDLIGPEDELKDLADTFDAMLDRLEAGVAAQRAFIQDTSHELRNPLAVMATNLDVVLADEGAGTAELRAAAEIVRRTVDRASRTVDELLTFARDEVPAERRVPVDGGTLIDEVVAEHGGPIRAGGLQVERAWNGSPFPADMVAMKRALANLVNNAVRLSPPGARLTVAGGEHEGWVWLGVEDQGPGIDPDYHASAFQRLWHHDETSLGTEPRSGLGLAITRQIAEAHGGTVTVRSMPGAGAAFVIWIPKRPDAELSTVTTDGIHPVWDPFA